MPSLSTLPFLPTQQSINNWLNSLNQLGCHRASNKLYEVLQALYQQAFTPQISLSLLSELTVPVITYADELEHLRLKQPENTVTPLIRKTANLSCQLLRLLSLNYGKVSLAPDLSEVQQLTAVYTALHLIGLWQCKLAVLNQCPSKTIWKMTAELYQRAQKYQLLNQPVIDVPFIATQQHCIAEVLQRNILFELFDPYHFNRNIIKKLFAFADTHYALLKIDVSAQQAHFAWTPRQLQAPTL